MHVKTTGTGALDETLLAHYPSIVRALSPNAPHQTQRNSSPQHYLEYLFFIFPKLSFQQANRSSIVLGIAELTSNKLQTNNNKPLANSQWRKIWSTDSPLNLHLQHQFVIITSFFLRLSIVKISPFSAVWEKESYMRESFDLPKSFPRKVCIAPVAQSFKITL